MCIYYKNRQSLEYDSGEHIFPAAIGGIKKLPKKYVSKDFNTDISGLELKFIREGVISIPRELLGPGKRGSLNINKATKSKVHLITNERDENNDTPKYSIGYTSLAKTYEIPHMIFESTNYSNVLFSYTEVDNIAETLKEFKQTCSNIEKLRFRIQHEDVLPQNMVIIGIKQNIEENFNCFVFKNPNNRLSVSKELIKTLVEALFVKETPKTTSYMPTSYGSGGISQDDFRVYAKIAFNFLADLKGAEFVLQSYFDDIRNWIAEGGENNFANINLDKNDIIETLNQSFPLDSHSIIIRSIGKHVVATVTLYQYFRVDVIISNSFNGQIMSDGFICDWRNKKEYRLYDYVHQT